MDLLRIYWIYPTLAFSKLWHKTLALTVLQTTMLAPPTMSTSASDDGNPNLRSPTDDGSAPEAKRRKGKGNRKGEREPSVPRARSSRLSR